MLLKKYFLAIAVSIAFLLISVTAYLHKDFVFTAKTDYVTSEQCQDCHNTHYNAWHDQTLHPRMFRPVTDEKEIQGDFSTPNPVVTFSKGEIEYVIGNKWEQVYARKIDGEYYPFTAKWLITTQKWIPYKVDTWRETPLSTQCNGCHTTGFDPETYQFTEFGIGCEACHGPGKEHVSHQHKLSGESCQFCHQGDHHNDKDIVVSTKSAVCGQCHSRGKQASDHLQTTFNFPIDYTPGQEISSAYKPMTQALDKNSKHWWGLGLSKNRHQEFADFSESKHSKSLSLLKSHHTDARGELTDACLQCHSQDYRSAPADAKPTLHTAEQGLTCVTCHNPHGMDRDLPSVSIGAERCGLCHADSMSGSGARNGRPHYPGPPSSKSCADCHMPYIVKSGGAYPIRSHAFKIVPPTASLTYDMPNSCQNGGCHDDRSVQWAIDEYEKHYDDYKRGAE